MCSELWNLEFEETWSGKDGTGYENFNMLQGAIGKMKSMEMKI